MKTMTTLGLGTAALMMTACSNNEPAANTEVAANVSEDNFTNDITAIDNAEGLSHNASDTNATLGLDNAAEDVGNATSNAL